MTSHITGKLLRAECNRIVGMATLQAEFEQTGKLYTRSKLVALQSFGHEDEDWQRCLDLYSSLQPGELYAITGDTLAASDGTVLLLGTMSIRHLPPVSQLSAQLQDLLVQIRKAA